MNLVEIGPRFTLVPIKILDGHMSGETIWKSNSYITPSVQRSKKRGNYEKRRVEKVKRK